MKDVSHQKIFLTGPLKVHVEPPLIPLIKIKNDTKAEEYCVNIKLNRYPTLEKSDLYDF